jgi:hypothetical protein
MTGRHTRTEPYEEQLARVFYGVRSSEADIDQVLAAMRRVGPWRRHRMRSTWRRPVRSSSGSWRQVSSGSTPSVAPSVVRIGQQLLHEILARIDVRGSQ